VVDTEGLLLPSMVTAALGSRPKRYLATVFSAEGYVCCPTSNQVFCVSPTANEGSCRAPSIKKPKSHSYMEECA
jgi:hypothetical protein